MALTGVNHIAKVQRALISVLMQKSDFGNLEFNNLHLIVLLKGVDTDNADKIFSGYLY